MKCIVVASLLVAAQAFTVPTHSPLSTSLKANNFAGAGVKDYNPELDGMTGAFIETGGRIWDPWGMSNWVPVDYAREAELANGRSAMLATVGWVWPKWFGVFPGFTDVTTTDPVDAALQADTQWWAQFIILCGVIEANKYWAAQKGQSYMGGVNDTPFYDPFGIYPKTEEGRAKMAERELKNARLAMIGIASFVAGHFIPGSVPCLPPGF